MMGQALSLHRNVKTQRQYAILGRRISQRFFFDLPCIDVRRNNTFDTDALQVRFSDQEVTVSVYCPAPSSAEALGHGCAIVRQLIGAAQTGPGYICNQDTVRCPVLQEYHSTLEGALV